jgi:hypothetical protein
MAFWWASGAPSTAAPLGAATYDPLRRLRVDLEGALAEWAADIDTRGSIWEDPYPHTQDAGYYGYIHWGYR